MDGLGSADLLLGGMDANGSGISKDLHAKRKRDVSDAEDD